MDRWWAWLMADSTASMKVASWVLRMVDCSDYSMVQSKADWKAVMSVSMMVGLKDLMTADYSDYSMALPWDAAMADSMVPSMADHWDILMVASTEC
jgi:hypothetical protein